MKTFYKILISIGIILILCTSSFILGRVTKSKDFDINELDNIKYKLERQKERNEELLQHIDDCEKIIKDLQLDNGNLNTKINSIISYTVDTQNKLNSITENISNSLEYIKVLQMNNKILQDYIENMENITNE